MSKPKLIVQPKGKKFSNYFHTMLERLGIVKRTRKPVTKTGHIKGRFGRMVLRNRARNQLGYKPKSLGLSVVSEAIKKDYGSILSRQERRQQGRFKAYYNGGYAQ